MGHVVIGDFGAYAPLALWARPAVLAALSAGVVSALPTTAVVDVLQPTAALDIDVLRLVE